MKVLLVSFLLIPASWAQAQSSLPASLVEFHGAVHIVQDGRTVPAETVPVGLSAGARIDALSGASAMVRLDDGSTVLVGPMASFKVERQDRSVTSLFLALGKLWISAAKLKDRRFEVRTANAVAAVRGTSFSVETDLKRTVTEVFDGAVSVEAVKDARLAGSPVLLTAGQRVEAAGGTLGAVHGIGKQAPSIQKAPVKKAELQQRLKDALAGPAGRDADKAAAIEKALKSGSVEEARLVATALDTPPPSAEEQAALLKAFREQKSLSEALTPPPAADLAGKWAVNREIGLQLHEDAERSLRAKGALSPAASTASSQVVMSGYQQQFTQGYLASQQAPQAQAGATGGPSLLAAGPAAPPAAPPGAAPLTTAASMTTQTPVSPVSPVFQLPGSGTNTGNPLNPSSPTSPPSSPSSPSSPNSPSSPSGPSAPGSPAISAPPSGGCTMVCVPATHVCTCS